MPVIFWNLTFVVLQIKGIGNKNYKSRTIAQHVRFKGMFKLRVYIYPIWNL